MFEKRKGICKENENKLHFKEYIAIEPQFYYRLGKELYFTDENDKFFIMYSVQRNPDKLFLGTKVFECDEVYDRVNKIHIGNEFEKFLKKNKIKEEESFVDEYSLNEETDSN